MCLLVFAWDCHPRYRLVFAGNRDEFHARPASPARWWDKPAILAGRDDEADGTWLGIARDGRFGVVTNFREHVTHPPGLRSRGELITGYLGDGNSNDFLTGLSDRAAQYAGYNLIVGNLPAGQLHYQSNRGQTGHIEPGLHGVSNHHLDTPWPKVARALSGLQELIDDPDITPDPILELLADRRQANPDELPETGIGPELERLLSSAFIVSPDYGTRCSTVVLVDRDNHVQFVERRFDASGQTTGESRFEFAAQQQPE